MSVRADVVAKRVSRWSCYDLNREPCAEDEGRRGIHEDTMKVCASHTVTVNEDDNAIALGKSVSICEVVGPPVEMPT